MYSTVNSMHVEYFDVLSNFEIENMQQQYAALKLSEV